MTNARLEEYGWDAAWEEAFAPHAAAGLFPGRVTVGYGMWLRVMTAEGEITAMRPGRMRLKARSPEELPVVGDWVALRPGMVHVPAEIAEAATGDAEDHAAADATAPALGATTPASGTDTGTNEDAVDIADLLEPADLADLHDDEEEPTAPPPGLAPPSAMIAAVLPRRTRLARKAPGQPTVQQVLAANVDLAWLVQALGPDFNPRRLERYLGLVREGGAKPVVVLNKADLVKNQTTADAFVELTKESAGADTPVLLVSGHTATGLAALRATLARGTTVTLLGSSGVGKSTIINALVGEEWFATQEVRNDGRGRHTTTRRELRLLPGGGVIVDTPGLREIQVWEGQKAADDAFPDIEELALECRFGNCGHTTEPDCAVTYAVEEGRLEETRLEAWHKLRAEAKQLEAQRDVRAREEKKRKERTGSRAMKQFKKR